jgi:hypothetical protein
VFLAMGNHEMISPMNRPQYIAQFADWLDQPMLREQRLADDPANHLLTTYNHWIERGVDFISMDNASPDMFDAAQMAWLKKVLAADAKDSMVQTLVVGMHEALPDSVSAGHSMNESPQETASGRKAYRELSDFRKTTGKNVYVIASHSHFLMDDVYNTACHKGDVLPGWIIGSAGAVRYRLPEDRGRSTIAKTDIYGYLLATVAVDGSISFQFKEVKESDIPEPVVKEFSPEQVRWCFEHNKSETKPANPTCQDK